MVNEAYLNRVNEVLPSVRAVWSSGAQRMPKRSANFESGQTRSSDHEAAEIDGLDPVGLRVDHQRADRECDAVGNSAFLGVQFEQPGLARQRIGQRPLPELKQKQR